MEDQDYRTTYQLEEGNWWFVGMRRLCLGLLDAARPAGAPGGGPGRNGDNGADTRRVLDVGCGTGINLAHLAPFGAPTGLDLSPIALQFCKSRGAERLVRARGERLPFADASFDVVTALGVVEHIEADDDALVEWARVLKPGGQVVLLTSAYQWLWSGHDVSNHHVRRYVLAEVEALIRGAGLVPDKVSYVNTLLFPPIAAVRGVERLARRRRPPAPRKDTAEVPPVINRALIRLLDLERVILERARLPFGVSIVGRATKPAAVPARP